jgi:L-alanine-DL-glutamate epimerase-like enolase superfamily enzyme
MKITQLETYLLSCPLPQPVHTSTHTISQVSEVIVQLSTDAGLVGIGEAHGPFLLRQGQEGLQAVSDIMRHLTPLVLGADPFNVERIWQELFALTYTSVRGVPPLARQQRQLITAMSAIDIALWDLMGKATERPVYALMGGALRQRLPAYVGSCGGRAAQSTSSLSGASAAGAPSKPSTSSPASPSSPSEAPVST